MFKMLLWPSWKLIHKANEQYIFSVKYKSSNLAMIVLFDKVDVTACAACNTRKLVAQFFVYLSQSWAFGYAVLQCSSRS